MTKTSRSPWVAPDAYPAVDPDRWKVGDVVALKSGGGAMTVTRYSARHGTVHVSWLLRDGDLMNWEFPEDAIKRHGRA